MKIAALKFIIYFALSVNSSISKIFSSINSTLIGTSGVDQFNIDLHAFFTFTCTNIYFDIGNDTTEMKTTVFLELVRNTYNLVILCVGTRAVLKLNQDFNHLDPSQTKALLAIHKVYAFGASIDNCAKCHHIHDGTPGTQSICTPKSNLEFHLDGKIFRYFNITKTT